MGAFLSEVNLRKGNLRKGAATFSKKVALVDINMAFRNHTGRTFNGPDNGPDLEGVRRLSNCDTTEGNSFVDRNDTMERNCLLLYNKRTTFSVERRTKYYESTQSLRLPPGKAGVVRLEKPNCGSYFLSCSGYVGIIRAQFRSLYEYKFYSPYAWVTPLEDRYGWDINSFGDVHSDNKLKDCPNKIFKKLPDWYEVTYFDKTSTEYSLLPKGEVGNITFTITPSRTVEITLDLLNGTKVIRSGPFKCDTNKFVVGHTFTPYCPQKPTIQYSTQGFTTCPEPTDSYDSDADDPNLTWIFVSAGSLLLLLSLLFLGRRCLKPRRRVYVADPGDSSSSNST